MKYEQTGIPGVSENKPFPLDENVEFPPRKKKQIARPKLFYYIRKVLQTDSRGFAALCNVSEATVSKWINTPTMPTSHLLKQMSNNLGIEFEELYDMFDEVYEV